MTGGDTDDVATMWRVFSATCPTKLVTLYKTIELEIDIENRVGRALVRGFLNWWLNPFEILLPALLTEFGSISRTALSTKSLKSAAARQKPAESWNCQITTTRTRNSRNCI